MVGLLRQLLVLLSAVLAAAWSSEEQQDKVLLREIKLLTFYPTEITKFRRTHPIPQLHCLGGSAGCVPNTPEVAWCYNRGLDGNDVLWECKVELEKSYRFGIAELYCEGYDSPDDPYILQGSCGLQYTLELTEEGYRVAFGNRQSSTVPIYGVVLILFGILIYVIHKAYTCPHQPQYRRPISPPGSYSGAVGNSSYGSASVLGFWTELIDRWLQGSLISSWRSPTYYSHPSLLHRRANPTSPPPTLTSSSGSTTPSETRFITGRQLITRDNKISEESQPTSKIHLQLNQPEYWKSKPEENE